MAAPAPARSDPAEDGFALLALACAALAVLQQHREGLREASASLSERIAPHLAELSFPQAHDSRYAQNELEPVAARPFYPAQGKFRVC